eukprot:scaffold57924_cov27-Tisochrysis_lutea.AAC.1
MGEMNLKHASEGLAECEPLSGMHWPLYQGLQPKPKPGMHRPIPRLAVKGNTRSLTSYAKQRNAQ